MGKHIYESNINIETMSNHTIKTIYDLQDKIEELRMELNHLATLDGLQGERLLKKSRELDLLLNRYHHVKLEFSGDHTSAKRRLSESFHESGSE